MEESVADVVADVAHAVVLGSSLPLQVLAKADG